MRHADDGNLLGPDHVEDHVCAVRITPKSVCDFVTRATGKWMLGEPLKPLLQLGKICLSLALAPPRQGVVCDRVQVRERPRRDAKTCHFFAARFFARPTTSSTENS